MATRGYLAKIERDGSGRHVYIGHSSYPHTTGKTLLQHYQDPDKVDRLLDLGAFGYIEPDPADILPYYRNDDHDWEHCRPVSFTGGTDHFFLTPQILGPEWLYAWTPDGWLASPVQREDMPDNFFTQLSRLTPEQFQDWFDNNQEPGWIAWRKLARARQEPRPLLTVIEEWEKELPSLDFPPVILP